MEVDAVNSQGFSAGIRRFLVGGSAFKYIALGDSYSSGEGIDPYFRDGWKIKRGVASQPGNVDNRCHRSTRAYAEQVQPPDYPQPLYVLASGGGKSGSGKRVNKYGSDMNTRRSGSVAWGFFACAGATMVNVLPLDQGGHVQDPNAGYREIYPQLDYPFVDYGTDLLTITIGGNDAAFADVLRHCATRACSTPEYQAEVYAAIDHLLPGLTELYNRLRSRTFNSRVIVLGYPALFPQSPEEQRCAKLTPFRGEQDFLREAGDRLNAVVEQAAADAEVEFVGVQDVFESHEVCGSQEEWINGPSFSRKTRSWFVDDESFHPNLDGQHAYARALNDHL